MNLSEKLHAGVHTYIVKGELGSSEFKWHAKSCNVSAVFPTPDAALVRIIRSSKTYLVTPPKLYAQWLCVYNVNLEQCIFPTSSTAVRKAGLPEGQGYVSKNQDVEDLKSVTIERVEQDELAAVEIARAAEADVSVAGLFYAEIPESGGSAPPNDSTVDDDSSEDVVDASANLNSAFLCMDQAAQNPPNFWLKIHLTQMGITKFEFTGSEYQLKKSKAMLQFLLGESILHDSDACVAWLVNAKFGEPKFTWKVLAENLKIAATAALPPGIIRPQCAGEKPESNDLRLAVFYAQVTVVLLRGAKMATQLDVTNLLSPPGCSFLHQKSRAEINNHIQCRHKHLQKLFTELLTLGSPKKCQPAHCAGIDEVYLKKAAESNSTCPLNIFQQFVCFAFWSWKFFDLVVSPREKPGVSAAQASRAAAIVGGSMQACRADQNITRVKNDISDKSVNTLYSEINLYNRTCLRSELNRVLDLALSKLDMGEGEPWLLLAMFGHTSITLYC